MIQLNPAECRVLGVLVEKAHTSSGYPMSLNALTDGCNQKSNRNPVVNFDEDTAMAALDSLRGKGLVVFADTLGSRVTKFRHNAREVLNVDNHELVVLVELLIRGPQTAEELRVRASRMKEFGFARRGARRAPEVDGPARAAGQANPRRPGGAIRPTPLSDTTPA